MYWESASKKSIREKLEEYVVQIFSTENESRGVFFTVSGRPTTIKKFEDFFDWNYPVELLALEWEDLKTIAEEDAEQIAKCFVTCSPASRDRNHSRKNEYSRGECLRLRATRAIIG